MWRAHLRRHSSRRCTLPSRGANSLTVYMPSSPASVAATRVPSCARSVLEAGLGPSWRLGQLQLACAHRRVGAVGREVPARVPKPRCRCCALVCWEQPCYLADSESGRSVCFRTTLHSSTHACTSTPRSSPSTGRSPFFKAVLLLLVEQICATATYIHDFGTPISLQ